MATRCPRCQKNDISLETFGVYRCPACGRIDADGNMLDIAAPPAESAVERVSFAPPPPKGWTPPAVTERISPVRAEPESNGPPVYFLTGVALIALSSLAGALSSRNWFGAVLQFGTLAALATGKPWARMLSIVGSALTIALALVVLALARGHLPGSSMAILGLILAANGAWLYILFRADTIRFFSTRR